MVSDCKKDHIVQRLGEPLQDGPTEDALAFEVIEADGTIV